MGFSESYTYGPAGLVTSKGLQMTRYEYYDPYGDYASFSRTAAVNYTYNNVGAVASVSYGTPISDPYAGPLQYYYYWQPSDTYSPEVLTYGFDTMGRPVSLTDSYATSAYLNNSSTYPLPAGDYIQWVRGVQYDVAGRMTTMQYLTGISDNGYGSATQTYATRTMAYNVNGQLTGLAWSGGSAGGVTGGITYQYSATQNNGQIQQVVDAISGETIAYQYDSLKRLASAASTPNAGSSVSAWTESFAYDGFGNMTQKTLNGTNYTIGVNSATNQVSSATYDLNGNMLTGAGVNALTYDVSNRVTSATMASGGIEYYGYSPDNKQVYRMLANGNEEITLFGGHGEKLEVMSPKLYYTYTYAYFQPIRTNLYFAGKMIWSDGAPVFQDRLGTNRMNGARFYPYGDEITSTSNDREKFGTYTRDSYTGLDYADQRYYASTYGRFNTVDPTHSNISLGDPASWNGYGYVEGDPINADDPAGLCSVLIGGINMAPDPGSAFSQIAGALGATTAYPYAGIGLAGLYGLNSVISQGFFGPNASTTIALAALQSALSTNSGMIDVVAYSGGAGAFSAAFGELSSADQQRIGNILYVSPGANGSLVTNSSTSVVQGTGGADVFATIGTYIPPGTPITDTNCNHSDFACLARSAQNQLLAIQNDGACSDPTTFSLGSSSTSGAPGGHPVNTTVNTSWPGRPTYPLRILDPGPVTSVTSTIKFDNPGNTAP